MGGRRKKIKCEARATAKWKNPAGNQTSEEKPKSIPFSDVTRRSRHRRFGVSQRKWIRMGTPAARTKAKVARRLFTASTKTRLAIKVSHLQIHTGRKKAHGPEICLYKSNLDGLWVNPEHSIPAWEENKHKNEGFQSWMLKFCTRYVPFAVTNEKRKGGRGCSASLHSIRFPYNRTSFTSTTVMALNFKHSFFPSTTTTTTPVVNQALNGAALDKRSGQRVIPFADMLVFASIRWPISFLWVRKWITNY